MIFRRAFISEVPSFSVVDIAGALCSLCGGKFDEGLVTKNVCGFQFWWFVKKKFLYVGLGALIILVR